MWDSESGGAQNGAGTDAWGNGHAVERLQAAADWFEGGPRQESQEQRKMGKGQHGRRVPRLPHGVQPHQAEGIIVYKLNIDDPWTNQYLFCFSTIVAIVAKFSATTAPTIWCRCRVLLSRCACVTSATLNYYQRPPWSDTNHSSCI